MRTIIVEIEGGNVQEVYSDMDDEPVEVYVIDWNNINGREKELLSPFPVKQLDSFELNGLYNHAIRKIKENNSED